MTNIYLKDIDESIRCVSSWYLFITVKKYLLINNYNIVNDIWSADYIIINICSALRFLESNINNYINAIRLQYNNKKIIIIWCIWVIENEIKWKVDYMIHVKNLDIISKIFPWNIKFNSLKWSDLKDLFWNIFLPSVDNDKKKYFLSIWRWCINNCSYCETKKSIWYIKSINLEDIYNDFIYWLNSWYKEFILVSDDALSYWKDIDIDFSILLDKLCSVEWDYKINIYYAEPWEFIKQFDSIKKNLGRINEMTLPIQTFSDRLLKLMNRNYTVKEYMELYNKIKSINSNLKIINHIIYAYPTETINEFMDIIKWIDIFDFTVFNLFSLWKYSKRYSKNELLSKDDIKNRMEILYKLNLLYPWKYKLSRKQWKME